jgi:hypothetical protein
MRNYSRLVSFAVALLLVLAGATTARGQSANAVVLSDAPIMLFPDSTRTPLQIAPAGTRLISLGVEGQWLRIQFDDPRLGRRNGYIESRFVQTQQRATVATPRPTPVESPVPPPDGAPAARLEERPTTPVAVPATGPPLAVTSIERNSVVYIEASDFGQALQAALLKKRVPLLVTTNREKAQLFIEETSKADKEGSGERVAKVLAFGVFAGSGKSYEASVTLTNSDGLVLWAHNSKKPDVRRAAEDAAERLEEHIKKQAKR